MKTIDNATLQFVIANHSSVPEDKLTFRTLEDGTTDILVKVNFKTSSFEYIKAYNSVNKWYYPLYEMPKFQDVIINELTTMGNIISIKICKKYQLAYDQFIS